VLEKSEKKSLVGGKEGAGTGHRESAIDVGVIPHDYISPVLKLVHLFRRGSFPCDHDAANEAAVSDRKKGFGNQPEKVDGACQAGYPDECGNPSPSQKPPESRTVNGEHALLYASYDSFHPRSLGALASVLEKPRAHQRSERQRHETRSQDGDD